MFLVSGQKSTGPAVLETSQLQMGQMDPNGANCKVCFHIRNSSYVSINERRICRYRRCHFLLAVCGFGSEPLFPFQEPNQHLLLPNHTQTMDQSEDLGPGIIPELSPSMGQGPGGPHHPSTASHPFSPQRDKLGTAVGYWAHQLGFLRQAGWMSFAAILRWQPHPIHEIEVEVEPQSRATLSIGG